jgi:hypothetical protein
MRVTVTLVIQSIHILTKYACLLTVSVMRKSIMYADLISVAQSSELFTYVHVHVIRATSHEGIRATTTWFSAYKA